MAIRPIFAPELDTVGVSEIPIDFDWFPGFSVQQKQKSIAEMHKKAGQLNYENLLEISSKSEEELGKSLSAFNLVITTKKYSQNFTVESAFQASKVFEKGGPYIDLLGMDSRKAKKDIRLKDSGNLISFSFFNKDFPIVPRTYFYDWLYINALQNHPTLKERVFNYDAFTDIEFNPKKSINCQAHSIALYVSLVKNKLIETALKNPESFLQCTSEHYKHQKRNVLVQSKLV